MSEYKGIKGFQVQTRTEDPTDGIAGDFYYNSSTGRFRNIVSGGAPIATWASGGDLNQSRAQGGQAGSTVSAGQLSAGNAYSPGISYGNTEQYNGTSWTEVNDINTIRGYGTGGGTQSGAIYVSGTMAPSPGAGGTGRKTNVETWDGSSWTEVADVNTSCSQAGGNGATSSATMKYGGETSGASPTKNNGKTELWNGSSWTEVADLNTARTQLAPFGTWTSQMASSGYRGTPAGRTSDSEVWDGTSWTEVAEPNGGTIEGRMGAGVDSTSGVIFGGRAHPTYYALTEIWDGTSWTETADMATARYNGTGMGSTASALAAGGVTSPGATVATTEEFFGADFVIKTVTTS